jgi:hypothetical protein
VAKKINLDLPKVPSVSLATAVAGIHGHLNPDTASKQVTAVKIVDSIIGVTVKKIGNRLIICKRKSARCDTLHFFN